MFFLLIIIIRLALSRKIIEFPELEHRSEEEICLEYQNNFVFTPTTRCYTPGTGCNYGTNSEEDLEATTKRVNYYRYLSGLNKIPRSTNSTYINYTRQASIILSSNNIFSHYLSNQSLKCWSKEGEFGAKNSNLALTAIPCSSDAIPLYMNDEGVASLGHRRWILNPPLSQVATGKSGSYSALLVLPVADQASNPVPTFIAFPPPGPVPHDLVPEKWSFSRHYASQEDEEHKGMPRDTKVNVVCDGEVLSVDASLDEENMKMYPGCVKFSVSNIDKRRVCRVSIASDLADTEWRYTVRFIKCVNGKPGYYPTQSKYIPTRTMSMDDWWNLPNDGAKSGDKSASGSSSLGLVLVIAGAAVAAIAAIIAIIVVVKKRKNLQEDGIDTSFLLQSDEYHE